MLLLNELLKIELVGDLALREHVDLLLQKMTADDDDECPSLTTTEYTGLEPQNTGDKRQSLLSNSR